MRKLTIAVSILLSIVGKSIYAQKIEINPFGSLDDYKEFVYEKAILQPDSVFELGIRNEYIKIPTLNIDSLRLTQFKNLKVITIVNYNLNDLSSFAYLSLMSVRISKCNITEIPQGLFKNRNLEFLSIHDNKLIELPKKIGKLKKLKRLILSFNQINSIPYRQLKHLKHLIVFNMYDNPIVENKKEKAKLDKLYYIIDARRVKQGIPKLYTVPLTDE